MINIAIVAVDVLISVALLKLLFWMFSAGSLLLEKVSEYKARKQDKKKSGVTSAEKTLPWESSAATTTTALATTSISKPAALSSVAQQTVEIMPWEAAKANEAPVVSQPPMQQFSEADIDYDQINAEIAEALHDDDEAHYYDDEFLS